MDVKYIGGDVPWTLPFGDHFYSSSQASFTDTNKTTSDLDTIARRHGFEPLYSTNETQSQTKFANSQWMNAGVLFTDKTIESEFSGTHKTDFSDQHSHTFCYLCSINQHEHPQTKPRDQSQRRKLIPYNNPKALKARSSSLDRLNSNSSTSDFISYRFIVRTGSGKNAGTRAKVFLYMYGTKTNWTSINLQSRSNTNFDGFPSGSTRTFCLKGPEIGHLQHLNVNLVGARSDKEWFLKEIEITNLNTSVSWLCEFNCWLPKKDVHEQIKPKIDRHSTLSLDNLCVYILQVRTGGRAFAGTDSTIQVVVRGSTSQTRQLPLTSDRADLFEQNQLDTFAIVGWDIGDLLEITVESDRSQIAADWDLKEMMMWKIFPHDDHHRQSQVYFPVNDWLGRKTSKLKAKRDSYSAPEHHPRGPTCYQVEAKTGKAMTAGTDANVFLIIYGKNGRTTTHHLDNQLKNDFERNTTSIFTIMDIDVGEIEQIKLWHDNSGAGPGWFLDSVIIRKKHSICRPITNVFVQRVEQISQALYRQACEQIKKIQRSRSASPKENDRRISKLKDDDDLGGNRSILRSPVMNNRTRLQRSVRFDDQSMGSQDEPFSIDTKRMKNMQKTAEEKRKKDDLSDQVDSGHYDHNAYWVSTHNYKDKKWLIQSIEERNSFDLDGPTRTLLLSDRLSTSSKIKTPINDKDDDVYDFQANRWLAKDEGDGKIEVTLTPKSKQLSTHTNHEIKSKSSTDKMYDSKNKHLPPSASAPTIRHDKYDDHKHISSSALGPLDRSPRSLASLDRSPRDTFKDQFDHPRSSQRTLPSSGGPSHDSFKEKFDDPRSSKRALPSSNVSPHDSFKDRFNDPRSSQRTLPSSGGSPRDTFKDQLDHPRSSQRTSQPSDRSSRDTLKDQFDHPRSSQRSLQPSDRSPHDSFKDQFDHPRSSQRASPPSDRFSRDTLKDQFNDPRSSQRVLPSSGGSPRDTIKDRFDDSRSLSNTLKRQEEFSLDKHHRPSSPFDREHRLTHDHNDRTIPTASQQELLGRISHEPSYHRRSAATSEIDARSSMLTNQPSKLSSPSSSHRDVSGKPPIEPSIRPKSAVRVPLDLSSHKTTRNQVYHSAYGTMPMDDF